MKKPTPKKTPEKFDYRVNVGPWCQGMRVVKGEIVQMTKAQAKYENVTLVTSAKQKSKDGAKEVAG